ncbi:metallophosphoesterase [Nonlabens xiamenensis]|uniref:metallophosphoesterase n=1 Tax=Nonlabens xiamenensis TaxID=2341043 RepID=UPI000F6122B0|nr:metallophosphoesterase [Nonlabens xiamenensis]
MSKRLLANTGILLVASCIITACAVKTTKFDGPSHEPVNSSTPYQQFFLLGNLNSKSAPTAEFESLISSIKSQSRPEDYTIVLGDNVDSEDFNEEDHDKKDRENYIKRMEMIANIGNQVLVIPGNEDWNDEGLKGLKSIEELTEDILDNDEVFQPENGCPFEELDISDSVHLFVVDSQWYIENWDSNPQFNDECEINTREKFLYVLGDEMRKQRHKTVIVAMHHPLYSNGIYGGQIGPRMIMKPSSDNGYIPVLGGAWSFIRAQGGVSRQDRFNPLMNELMESIKDASADIDRLFFVSAHDRSLQYIDDGAIKQLVSGTAVEEGIATLGKKGRLSSGQLGYAILKVYQDQSSQVEFYTLEDNKIDQVYAHSAFAKAIPYNTDSLPPVTQDFVKSSVYKKEETEKDADFEEFYGKHYRYLYGIEVEAPVVKLDTLFGGMRVERAGGGNQTQGLRLLDAQDREFNMRALEKDALQFLKSAGYGNVDTDKYFAETIPQEMVRDFYTAAHPYGAFAVPRLAGAIDLNHTHPKLYYIPKQEVLGDFNEIHGNRLYMIVEKPDKSFDDRHMFGNNQDVESTSDFFKKIREDEHHVVDERLYIRARIFDMLLGDWDRHEDQWRWAEIVDPEDEDKKSYIAVPRDRDQVFARFDGKLLESLHNILTSTRQFGNYGPDIKYIKEFSQSAIKLDRAVLQRSDLDLWQEEVKYIQENITPEIVALAFNEMPDEVKDDLWSQTQLDLLARKENLPDIVDRYYQHFISFQTLKGTDKDDYFEINGTQEGMTHVVAYRIIDGEKEGVLFDRTFDPEQTDELWIYGLDDDDVFEINNMHLSRLKVVISGGKGDDEYKISRGNGVSIYDYDSEDNEFTSSNGAKVILRDDYEINHYDTEKVPVSKGSLKLDFAYNPDTGFTPTLFYNKTHLGFERNPYSSKLGIGSTYYSLTQAAKFWIEGGLGNALGHWNLEGKAQITTNNYTENFFGYGNNTNFDRDTDYDLNRILMQRQEVTGELVKIGSYGSSFKLGLGYQAVELDGNSPANTGVTQARDDYMRYHFDYAYESRDHQRFPTRGMVFKASTAFTDDLSNDRKFFSVDPHLEFWNAMNDARSLVLNTRVAAQTRIGDDPYFYQAARLGADQGLRSFRQQRFTANYALNAGADLAYDLPPLRTKLLPLRLIPYLGYDVGKVWQDDRRSSRLHNSYGGGLHIGMTGLFNSHVSYFHGEEGGRLQFGLSFSK